MIEKKEIIKSLEETIEVIKKMPKAEFIRTFKEVSETLCNSCARQNYCGNNTQKNYCAGYMPYVETRWEADDIKTPPFTQGLKKIIQATEKLAEKGKYRGVDDDL